MPYYNTFPVSYYNPYQPNYSQPSYQQVQQQPVAQPQPQIQPSNSILWVSGEKEAAMFPIAPNSAVTLWSQSEPVVYMKQADASGKPTMKTYDLVERTEAPQSNSTVPDKKPNFATKDELTAVVGAVRGVNDTVSAIRAEIDSIKGDIYGLAGKKRTVKAKEEDDG